MEGKKEPEMKRFHVPSIIEKKSEGQALSEDEINFFISAVSSGEVQQSQLGAWLMAVYLRSMTLDETIWLTAAMVRSGEVLAWPEEWRGLVADKHSTGGVGDKVSLPLAPALAACGLKVPMISGRGLGHTGGTLDKLESIPGFQVSQSAGAMKELLAGVGCCIVGQTETLVPADKTLYATRDITGTVCSLPLIAASIVSKKAAENLTGLVLDVKTGKGAMLKDEKQARELASTMVGISKGLGIKTVAVLTDNTNPIGLMVGNALEVREALDCLQGRGPEDLTLLVTHLGGQLLHCMGKTPSAEEGSLRIAQSLQDGAALAKFKAMIVGQGVSESVANELCAEGSNSVLPRSECQSELKAKTSGFVAEIDALVCARVSGGGLGAGRAKAGDAIQYNVGLQLHIRQGDAIEEGQTWMTVHHNKPLDPQLVDQLQNALSISTAPVDKTPRIMDIFT